MEYGTKGELEFFGQLRIASPSIAEIFNCLITDFDSGFAQIFVDLAKFYAETAADIFPRTARNIKSDDLLFIERRISKTKEIVRSKKWKDMKPSSGVTTDEWANALVYIEDCLHKSWARRLVQSDEATNPTIISIPETDLVKKYALPVNYYTSSWLVSRISAATTVKGRPRKRIYGAFAKHHNLSVEDARDKYSLPTGLVDRRERKSLSRASPEFFAFTRKVESVHLANLNLPMMLKYPDGTLPTAIQAAVAADDGIVSEFDALCRQDDGVYIDGLEPREVRREILMYAFVKFSRMRGREFERAIRGQSKTSQSGVSGTTTRIGVTVALESSREASSREQDMENRLQKKYKHIESTILEFPADSAVDVDDDESKNDDDGDSDSDDY